MKRVILSVILTCSLSSLVQAEIITETVSYSDDSTMLEGYLAYPDTVKDTGTKVPGVLIVHQWMGLTDYEKSRARQLAELGYVTFALDIYGVKNRPADTGGAGQMAGKFKGDRDLYRNRLLLGYEQLRKSGFVDKGKTAAIGYCFGGTGVLELARAGADVKGVVSFHGGLDSTNKDDGKNIKASILICHGADDRFVPVEDIAAMIDEFNAADVDWQMISYSGCVHAFTQPMAGNDPSRGVAYNEKADKRSWAHMKIFFNEIFE